MCDFPSLPITEALSAQKQSFDDIETSNVVNPKSSWRQTKFRSAGSRTIRYCRLGRGHSRCKVKEECNICAGNFRSRATVQWTHLDSFWFPRRTKTEKGTTKRDSKKLKCDCSVETQGSDQEISPTKKQKNGKNKLLKSEFPCLPGRYYASSCTGSKQTKTEIRRQQRLGEKGYNSAKRRRDAKRVPWS